MEILPGRLQGYCGDSTKEHRYVSRINKDNKEGVTLLISLPLYVCNVCVCMIIVGQCICNGGSKYAWIEGDRD